MISLFKSHMPELPELMRLLHSGNLAYGEYTKRFETSLKSYFEVDELITTNTFSSAINVAIAALGLQPGDEVIASPMACLVSTQPYAARGLNIVWADIDPARGTLSPESVRKKITSRTKCILHNHFCGYPGYIDEINAIGKEFGISVIDDGIECFGSEYKGKKIGAGASDITVFSFSAVRIPNTIDGGAVLFHNREHYEKSLLLRDCGIDRSRFRDEMGEISPDCNIHLNGFSAMMSNVNGYIGLRQMEVAKELLEKQRRQAGRWMEFFKNGEEIPLAAPDILPNYWVFGLLARDKRAAIQKYRDAGYYASGVHMNNNRYSAFGEACELPGVSAFYDHFVALPCGWWMEP